MDLINIFLPYPYSRNSKIHEWNGWLAAVFHILFGFQECPSRKERLFSGIMSGSICSDQSTCMYSLYSGIVRDMTYNITLWYISAPVLFNWDIIVSDFFLNADFFSLKVLVCYQLSYLEMWVAFTTVDFPAYRTPRLSMVLPFCLTRSEYSIIVKIPNFIVQFQQQESKLWAHICILSVKIYLKIWMLYTF